MTYSKAIIFFVLSVVATHAKADFYTDCELIGESDSNFVVAPSTIHLESAEKWYLTINNKSVVDFRVDESTDVSVEYTTLKNGLVNANTIIFNIKSCDSEQSGAAVWKSEAIGASDSRPVKNSSTGIYECKCAID